MIDCKDKKYGFKDYDYEEKTRGKPPVKILNMPKPENRLKLVYQSFNQSVEEVYFWLLSSLRDDFGLHTVYKVTDIFSASEQSAFWGASQQRLQLQQGQVSNYLATIAKMVKDLFQLVREIRILDERLNMYHESNKAIKDAKNVLERRRSVSAEIVLRGYWVDLKDGGVKAPGSVYGLATTLGYTTLPDLFFAAPPMTKDEVDKYVNDLKFNDKVKGVLKRKLQAYCVWKEYTTTELANRKNFTIKYLRQHYNSIQLYINWVKPYLRNVKRLQQNFARSESEDLIGAFEGSFTEIEILCTNKINKTHHAVVALQLLFRTQPHMDFHQDGYQHKGPVHVGRSEFTLRGYAWTDKELEKYIQMRKDETMDMIGEIDSSLKESLDSLGDDLRKYLKEAGEKFPEDEEKEKEEKQAAEKKRHQNMMGAAEPFIAVLGGFKEIFGAMVPQREKKSKAEIPEWQANKNKSAAIGAMRPPLWNTYKNFKKAHRMVTW
ncbi:hypothetical protein HQ545_04415 [Candidatus Woesearchaeota archaeon]|nr:hypothetical protein [Candidatus Woesearchaeota archaeon]